MSNRPLQRVSWIIQHWRRCQRLHWKVYLHMYLKRKLFTVTIRKTDGPVFKWSFFGQNLYLVFEWLAILFLTFEKRTGYFYHYPRPFIQKNIIFMTLLCIKRSRLPNHLKTRQICLVFKWSAILLPFDNLTENFG
jgi:hypothetical protein